jgi:hypothetical protein
VYADEILSEAIDKFEEVVELLEKPKKKEGR